MVKATLFCVTDKGTVSSTTLKKSCVTFTVLDLQVAAYTQSFSMKKTALLWILFAMRKKASASRKKRGGENKLLNS